MTMRLKYQLQALGLKLNKPLTLLFAARQLQHVTGLEAIVSAVVSSCLNDWYEYVTHVEDFDQLLE